MGMTRFDEAAWSATLNGHAPLVGELVRNTEGKPAESLVFETVIAEDDSPLLHLTGGEGIQIGQRRVGRIEDDDGDYLLMAEPAGHDGIFHIIGSIPASDRRWKRIERRISRSAPYLLPCYLNHHDFEDIGAALSEFGEVEVRQMSARHLRDAKSINHTWARKEGALRPAPREVIDDAEQMGASVRALRLSIEGGFDLHIRRLSGATFYSGEFRVFESTVLPRLAAAAHRRRELMHGRERHTGEVMPEPIQVVIGTDLFKSASDTGHILDHISKVSNLSHAVVHRNPYFHLSVTDHHDGSNFDVTVTSPGTIEISPGFRATAGSLTALAQSLSDWFTADSIREAHATEAFSMYDLIAE